MPDTELAVEAECLDDAALKAAETLFWECAEMGVADDLFVKILQ